MSGGQMFFSEEVVMDDEQSSQNETYKLLIVDDEPGIHEVTKMALRHFDFHGGGLEILSAYSGNEAKEVVVDNPDVAVILLDVVMETSSAGLDFADWIRNDHKNTNVRIVLRTGQPGESPESEIMVRYDINDYKEKTELTNRKLKTLMYACLRAFNDIKTIERASARLKTIIESSHLLFKPQTGEEFSQNVIDLLAHLIHERKESTSAEISSITSKNGMIVYSTGAFEGDVGKKVFDVCHHDAIEKIIKHDTECTVVGDHEIYVYLKSKENAFLVYVERLELPSEIDRDLLSLFFRHVSIGYRNTENAFGQS